MGCDISAYIEISKDNKKTWELAIMNVICKRDYALFGIMAGVRGGLPKIMKNGLERAKMRMRGWPRHYGSPRGFPENISKRVYGLFFEDDWHHNNSYGDLEDVEFWEYLDIREKQTTVDYAAANGGPDTFHYPVRSLLTDVILSMKKQINVGRGRSVRLVFWFDS